MSGRSSTNRHRDHVRRKDSFEAGENHHAGQLRSSSREDAFARSHSRVSFGYWRCAAERDSLLAARFEDPGSLEALGLQERVAGPGFRSCHQGDVAARTGPRVQAGTGAQTLTVFECRPKEQDPVRRRHRNGHGAAHRRPKRLRYRGVIVLPRFIGFGLGPP